jgi:TetR/AcrR family transcriptional regulator, transcriptional repressor for nem operon
VIGIQKGHQTVQPPSPKAEEILDLAEHYVRTVGYNGFSFRDLAEDAGIKSASVHYHFPTKERLAAAVARRYSERFFAALGLAGDTLKSPVAQMSTFVDLFRRALREDGRMCLFCVLGAEFSALPREVQDEVRRFIGESTDWLLTVLERSAVVTASRNVDADAQARTILATLEGAMIVARASDDLAVFDRIIAQVRRHGLMPG